MDALYAESENFDQMTKGHSRSHASLVQSISDQRSQHAGELYAKASPLVASIDPSQKISSLLVCI